MLISIGQESIEAGNWRDILDPHAEYDSAEPSTKHHFYCPPRFPSQHIQITCKGDTGEQIGEEDIDGGS